MKRFLFATVLLAAGFGLFQLRVLASGSIGPGAGKVSPRAAYSKGKALTFDLLVCDSCPLKKGDLNRDRARSLAASLEAVYNGKKTGSPDDEAVTALCGKGGRAGRGMQNEAGGSPLLPDPALQTLARISHRDAFYIRKGSLSSLPYLDWAQLKGLRIQTALGMSWLGLFPSARTCSLERSDRHALRSRARAEGNIPAPLSHPSVRNAGSRRSSQESIRRKGRKAPNRCPATVVRS